MGQCTFLQNVKGNHRQEGPLFARFNQTLQEKKAKLQKGTVRKTVIERPLRRFRERLIENKNMIEWPLKRLNGHTTKNRGSSEIPGAGEVMILRQVPQTMAKTR